jgi:hypothetical protein
MTVNTLLAPMVAVNEPSVEACPPTAAISDYRQGQLYFADDFLPVQMDGQVFGQLPVKELLP